MSRDSTIVLNVGMNVHFMPIAHLMCAQYGIEKQGGILLYLSANEVFEKYEGLVYAQKLARRNEDLKSEATLALWIAALKIASGVITPDHEVPYILSCVNKAVLKFAIANSSLRLEKEGKDERTSLSVYTDNEYVDETFENYRHREVAHLLLEGYSVTEISKILRISPQATRLRIRGIKEVLHEIHHSKSQNCSKNNRVEGLE